MRKIIWSCLLDSGTGSVNGGNPGLVISRSVCFNLGGISFLQGVNIDLVEGNADTLQQINGLLVGLVQELPLLLAAGPDSVDEGFQALSLMQMGM